MNWNDHSKIKGYHAFLGASQNAWLNYDDEKVIKVYKNKLEAQRGTRLHELACELIELGIKLPETNQTLNMYVNDAIGYRMTPEQILFYSSNCFGTTDAISFKDNVLRIHDFKSGVTPCNFNQTYIYAALFCLEYKINPTEIVTYLRIYQSDEILEELADPKYIQAIMKKIKRYDKILNSIK